MAHLTIKGFDHYTPLARPYNCTFDEAAELIFNPIDALVEKINELEKRLERIEEIYPDTLAMVDFTEASSTE